jgi:hypothetical protein
MSNPISFVHTDPHEPSAQALHELFPVRHPEPAAAPDTTPISTHKLPSFDRSQQEAARADWIKLGLSPEAFDKALRRDGGQPIVPDDPKEVELRKEFGLEARSDPNAYTPSYNRDFIENIEPAKAASALGELRNFAADLGLNRERGTAAIEHLVELGQQFRRMSPDQTKAWSEQQEALGIRLTGSKAAMQTVRAKALAVVQRSKGAFAADLTKTPAWNSWWLVSSLANHSDVEAAFQEARNA